MTAIAYPDCWAVSPNGRLRLEARSPYNGTITGRNRKSIGKEDFRLRYRVHQDEFRYQLIETARGSTTDVAAVIWERWQEKGEDSPHEVVVSDAGWSIVRTHGFEPELIALSPYGEEILRVSILGPRFEDSEEEVRRERQRETDLEKRGQRFWRAAHLQFSTAGMYWTAHSCQYFFAVEERTYFAWRPYWGQYLILDLTYGLLLDEQALADPMLRSWMQHAERTQARELLADLANHTAIIPHLLADSRHDGESEEKQSLRAKMEKATSAIHLVGIYQLAECLPALRCLEAVDWVSYSVGSTAMGDDWWTQVQSLRPILHHTLRLLDQEPLGYPAYHFIRNEVRVPLPERMQNRRERSAHLRLGMDAPQVLELLGSPDHVRRNANPCDEFFRWSEVWEYDFLTSDGWKTLCVRWQQGHPTGRLEHLEEIPSPWLISEDRLMNIFEH